MARREVDRWLRARHVVQAARHDVLLVVSELVTNAVEHTASAPALEVTHRAGQVRVAVTDHGDASGPALKAGGAGGGFGLQIVARAARRWGWEPSADGKIVWAELAVTRTRP